MQHPSRPPHSASLNSDRAPPLPPEPSEAQAVVAAPRQRPHGFRRALGIVASLVGTAITFAAAMAGGTLLHVGIAPARRITSAAVNQILDGTFRGKIAVTRVGALGPNHVEGTDATLSTHDGARIVSAEGIRARIALGPLLWSLVKGGALAIHVTELSIDHVDALLEEGPDGQLTVAEAFLPGKEGPPPPPTKPSDGIDLALPHVTIRSAWVHGGLGSAPPIDATIEQLAAAFAMTPKTMSASAAFVGQARGITKKDPIDLDVHAGLDANVIDAAVRATTGKASVDVKAHATIPSDTDPTTNANVTVAARDVDARAFGGPTSTIGVDTTASARIDAKGAIAGTYDVHVLPGAVAAQATPDARIGGTFTDKRVAGSAHVAEAGLPLELRYDVSLAAANGPDVAFELTTRARDLRKIAQLGGALEGSALVQAQGHALIGAKTVDAKVETQVDDLVSGGIAVNHATADGVVRGPFEAPHTALLLAATGVRVGTLSFPIVSAEVSGSTAAMHVDTKLHGRGGQAIKAVGDVAVGEAVTISGMRVDGAGAPLTGEVRVAPGSISARLQTTGIDLGEIARFIEGDAAKPAGRVALDVDVTATKHATKGHATITALGVTDGKFVQSLTAKLDAKFDGRAVEAHLDARDPKLGHVKLDTDGAKLAGGALDPRAWRDATGTAHVDVDVDLAKATQASPIDLPIEQASGALVAKVDLTRDDAKRRPSIALDLATQKLTFTMVAKTTPNADGTLTVVSKPFHSENLDAHVVASVDGDSGATKVNAQVHDKIGVLLAFDAAATLPLRSLFEGTAEEALLATAVKVHAQVPLRPLDSLPPMLGTLPIRGSVGFVLDASGDARSPHITGELQAQNIIDADDPTPIPISFDTKIDYDGSVGHVILAGNRPNKRVLDADATMNVRVADILSKADPLPWEASADVKLSELPIGALADFANQEVDGNVSGTIALHDLHKAGALSAKLALDHIVLSGASFPRATASLEVKDGTLAAGARIEQTDGYAEVNVGGGMKWGDEVAPSLDEAKGAEVKLVAKNFRAIAAAPFLQGVFDELDGIVNANAALHIKPGFKDGTMDGNIAIDKGLFETPAVGEEFHDLTARVSMKPWGTWNVQQLSARGTSGRFTATAAAKMNGFHLQSAEAHVKIAEREKLPLSMQGTALGTAWGQIDAKGAMTPDGKKLDLDVSVPNFHVNLEDATGHGVQSTAPDTTISVGVIDKHGKMERLAFDGSMPLAPPKPAADAASAPPMTIHVVTHLGPDLEILRGTMLKAYVSQGPVIDVGATTKISGVVDVPRGYVELQGKRFQIERTSVTFTGQAPDNPIVQATAVYVAPDAQGTKVIAKFIGPVKTGKLTLESEPELSQNEILSLLMFGSSDGTFGQSAPQGEQGNDTTQAASLAGGVVTQGLNKAISGVSGVDVQTSVDTEETGNPRPEVEVALSRKVSATVMYSLGVPPPGENPDDTLLVVDWRFRKNYSTETTLGDKGTTILDLLWKYRY
jgi:translocation and assembly module TamB